MKRFCLFSICVAIGLAGSACGEIIVTGSGAAGDARISFDQDVTFTLTADVPEFAPLFFVIETTHSTPGYTELGMTNLTYSIGAGSTLYDFGSWIDTFGSPNGVIQADDSVLVATMGASASAGATITLKSGFGQISSANGSFTAFESGGYNMFLADVGGSRVSDIVAVPEPSAMALIVVAALGGLMGRRWLIRNE